jgi:hypothetical protein
MCGLHTSFCKPRNDEIEPDLGIEQYDGHRKLDGPSGSKGFSWYCPRTGVWYEISIGAAGEICPGCENAMKLK